MTIKAIITSVTIAATATFGITSKAHAGSDADKIIGLAVFAAILAALADDDNEPAVEQRRAHKPKHHVNKRHHTRHREQRRHKSHHHGRRKVHHGIRHRHGPHGAYHFHKQGHGKQQRQRRY